MFSQYSKITLTVATVFLLAANVQTQPTGAPLQPIPTREATAPAQSAATSPNATSPPVTVPLPPSSTPAVFPGLVTSNDGALEMKLVVGPGRLHDQETFRVNQPRNFPVQFAVYLRNKGDVPFSGYVHLFPTIIRQQVELPPQSRKVYTFLSETPMMRRSSAEARLYDQSNNIIARCHSRSRNTNFSRVFYLLGWPKADDGTRLRRAFGLLSGNVNNFEIQPVEPDLMPTHPLGFGPPGTFFIYPDTLVGMTTDQVDALVERLNMQMDRLLFFSNGLATPFTGTPLEPFLPVREVGDVASVGMTTFGIPDLPEHSARVGVTVVEPIAEAHYAPSLADSDTEFNDPTAAQHELKQYVIASYRAYVPFNPFAVELLGWPARDFFFSTLDTQLFANTEGMLFNQTMLDNDPWVRYKLDEYRDTNTPTENTLIILFFVALALGIGLMIVSSSWRKKQPDVSLTFWWVPVFVGGISWLGLSIFWMLSPRTMDTLAVTYLVDCGSGLMKTTYYGLRTLHHQDLDLTVPDGSYLTMPHQNPHPLRLSMPIKGQEHHRIDNLKMRRREFDVVVAHQWTPYESPLSSDDLSTSALTLKMSSEAEGTYIDRFSEIRCAVNDGTQLYSSKGAVVLGAGSQTEVEFGSWKSLTYRSDPELNPLMRSIQKMYWPNAPDPQLGLTYLIRGVVDIEAGHNLHVPLTVNGNPITPDAEEVVLWTTLGDTPERPPAF